jgi:hypothetical protein
MSRTSIALGLVITAVAAAPLSATASSGTPNLRGQSLSKLYHLGRYAGPSPQEVRALTLRGQALNRMYTVNTSVGATKQEVAALKARGEAMNRAYHLGAYASSGGSSFPWSIVAIFAVGLAAIVLVFGTAVGAHKRHTTIPV